MASVIKIIALSIFLIFSYSLASARTATEAELATLKTSINNYIKTIETADSDAVINTIPPQIIAALAKQSQTDPANFRTTMVSQIKNLTSSYKIDNFTFDQKKSRTGELTDGEPYFVIPIRFVLTNSTNNNEKNRITAELVALLQNNQWYFVRGDDEKSIATFASVFPGFEKITLKQAEVKKIK